MFIPNLQGSELQSLIDPLSEFVYLPVTDRIRNPCGCEGNEKNCNRIK